MMSETIVLLHGFGFDYRIWFPVELAFDGFRLVHLQLPGFGEDPVTSPYSIETLAAQFWQEIDPQLAPNVHLAGMSMGGYVVMEMSAQQPSRVKSLALLHSHVFADTEEKKKSRTAAMEQVAREGRAGFVEKMISSLFARPDIHDEIIRLLIRRGMRYDDKAWYWGIQAMRDRNDHAATLSGLTVPVLMVLGAQDAAVSMEIAYRQSHLAERNCFHVLPDTGHMGMYEQTDFVISILSRFYHTSWV